MASRRRLSLVIPAFNESRSIRPCLESIARQTVMPDEVIVVDNHSTDDTATIAASFPFVRVIRENRQGVTYARTAGFDAAVGDVIGRTDADSRLAPDWVEHVLHDFADPDLVGVCGMLHATEFTFGRLSPGSAAHRIYNYHHQRHFGAVMMPGANMAIRRSTWRAIRNHIAFGDDQVNDDLHVSLLVAGVGKVVFDTSLEVHTPMLPLMAPQQAIHYLKTYARTIARHR